MSESTSPEVRGFESALRENPHDLAAWCAYADFLADRGDPRGEFMQTQLALEDESLSKEARDALKVREAEFLSAHQREWLGELAPFLLDAEQPEVLTDKCGNKIPPTTFLWRRGFLWALDIEELDTAFARALATAPAARFLHTLRVRRAGHEGELDDLAGAAIPRGIDRYSPMFELIGSPLLYNLRVFQFGPEVTNELDVTADRWHNGSLFDCWTYIRGLEHVVASMGRVEELHLYCKAYDPEAVFVLSNLTDLRVLRVYHLETGRGSAWRQGGGHRHEYPLDVLATNPAFANLTHLLLHPHFADDCFLPLDQLQAVLTSEHLTKLAA
ncbi:MAG: TIGR02996 domain-containing protein, partial [Gemmataceae bacterium]|nr:TIGR02996 domain-containing protein [Gemmataceae bacterium]